MRRNKSFATMNSTPKKNSLHWLKLIGSLLVCQLTGALGALSTASSVGTWYMTLNKPFFNPPGWLFGPVWTLLYLLMGIALYLIWNSKAADKDAEDLKKAALRLFGLQLLLNATWSFSFFGLQSPLLGIINILILLIFIIFTIRAFSKINQTASKLLWPYLAWVSFASILNAAIFYLN